MTLVNQNCVLLLESQVDALEGHNRSLIEKNKDLESQKGSFEHSLKKSKATIIELEADFNRIIYESGALYADAKKQFTEELEKCFLEVDRL